MIPKPSCVYYLDSFILSQKMLGFPFLLAGGFQEVRNGQMQVYNERFYQDAVGPRTNKSSCVIF